MYVRKCGNGRLLTAGHWGSSVKVDIPRLSLRTSLSGIWFHTQDYASRVYMYEKGLLYAVFYDVLVWKRRAMGLDNGL